MGTINGGSPSPEPTIEDLLAPVLAEFAARRPGEDPSMIAMAGKVAAESHDGQLRRSGEPYITHPIAVSEIAASLGLDATTIAAALLHDAVEDTRLTLEEITAQFGSEVANVVDGVTKLDRLHFDSKEAQQAATIRKMLIAMASDWRVLLIKLADLLLRAIGPPPRNSTDQVGARRPFLSNAAPEAICRNCPNGSVSCAASRSTDHDRARNASRTVRRR